MNHRANTPTAQPMAEKAHTGFSYDIEIIRNGKVIQSESGVSNLMPSEGRNHIAEALFLKKALATDWYFGAYESNVTPSDDLRAATVAAALGESTAYAPSTRPAFVPGPAVAGAVDNMASRAEMTFSVAKRIYGAFIVSNPTKGGASGVVLSAVRFPEPKDVTAGDTIRLTGAFHFVSA